MRKSAGVKERMLAWVKVVVRVLEWMSEGVVGDSVVMVEVVNVGEKRPVSSFCTTEAQFATSRSVRSRCGVESVDDSDVSCNVCDS